MQNCDISFTGKDDLNGHINAVHDEKKPFKCEFCDYSYDQIDILQQHVASVHEGKKPFIFEYCDYCSYQKEDVQQHVASVHEGKKPFKCEYCDYFSNQEGDMKQHVAPVHTKESCSTKTFSFTFVSAGSVALIIKRLNNTKAMGVDKVQTEVLKKGSAILAGPIARICNLSLSSGIFPENFKQAIIQPIFKENGKDPRDPGSYRPISILPALSKILEIAVRDALVDWLMLQDFIPDSQFGCPTKFFGMTQ